ncbi:alpha/beta hydrolase [Candidatus Nomurabacteria bacterium]|nr:alpha/beta hydrolase [Candidatus Nomurabacteria bacterium]
MSTFPALHLAPVTRSKNVALLFLAGLWSVAEVWSEWQQLAAKRGYGSWALTLKPKTRATSLKDYALYVLDFLKEPEGRGTNPVIIGHSMAGLVTQMVAEHYNLPGVVLLNSAAPAGISNFSLPLALRIFPYLKSILGNELFMPSLRDSKALLFNNLGNVTAEVMSAYHQELVPDSGKAAREIILGTVAVKHTYCPTLILGGSQDRILPTRIQRKLATKYSSAIYLEVDHGHVTMLEPSSDLVLHAILDWTEKLPPL